ncbi:MAG TPA: rhodanese-like domain-containing protein [Opitutaceae bacterium]|nr:rhodanese-like domain-containing protein [Opitutaceae bacterium]
MNPLKHLFSRRTAGSPPVRDVSPAEAARLVSDGKAALVDVREHAEWTGGVAAPAHLLALSDLNGARAQWQSFLASHKERELILYCAAGSRSGSAAHTLAAEGFRTANLGGFSRWRDAGLPVRNP